MVKMVQLFRTGGREEAEAFFAGTYKPVLDQLPGLERYEASLVTGLPLGEFQANLIVDLYFQDEPAMDAAFASAEGKNISRELTALGGKNVESIESVIIE